MAELCLAPYQDLLPMGPIVICENFIHAFISNMNNSGVFFGS